MNNLLDPDTILPLANKVATLNTLHLAVEVLQKKEATSVQLKISTPIFGDIYIVPDTGKLLAMFQSDMLAIGEELIRAGVDMNKWADAKVQQPQKEQLPETASKKPS